jgi:hypothetical protein
VVGLGRIDRIGGGSDRVFSLVRRVAGRGGGACGTADADARGAVGTGGAFGGAGLGATGAAGAFAAAGLAWAGFGFAASTGLGFGASLGLGFATSAGLGFATTGGWRLALAGSGVVASPAIEIGALQLRHGTVPPRLRTILTTSSPSTNVVEQALQCTCMARHQVYTERWHRASNVKPTHGSSIARRLG